jgi:DNA-binding transcriptional regulator YdaS (Cro superfamily)
MTLHHKNFPKQKKPLIDAILKFQNPNQFSKLIGVSRQVVDGWLHVCKLSPPAKYCKRIEEITNGQVTRQQLRPDLFGDIISTETTDQEKLEGCIFTLREIAENLANKKKGVD